MGFDLSTCDPAQTVEELARTIARAQGSDRMAPVTVVVPTNATGVMARRALGRRDGILGVDMVTLNRLAELVAGPSLAHDERRPVSNPVLELAVRRVLARSPGSFASVATHPATVVALREAHQELRLAGPDAADRLGETSRGREVVRVSAAVTALLEDRWYDEADLLSVAAATVARRRPDGLGRIVLHLPDRLDALSLGLVRALADGATVSVVVALTGDPDADAEQRAVCDQLGADVPALAFRVARPRRVVSTTDADDEVRIAVRTLVDAARGTEGRDPVRFERMAILWPTHRPYARLVEHHLVADGLPWNGRGGTELTERIAPRLVLDLLDIDRRGLRREALFELLADIPLRDGDGRIVPTAEWERAARAAGISRDEDWVPRLSALAHRTRWAAAAPPLLEFVTELRAALGHPRATRTWADWVDWCADQITRWLGPTAVARFDDVEYRAWEALMSSLERLRFLDEVADPADRTTFRTVLESELEDAAVREGRIGTGITVGSLASAGGLDLDVAVVLGAGEGMLPPSPGSDPLLSSADRERAGLVSADQRSRRLHHAFVATTLAADTVVTFPRGDLRATTANHRSRWLDHLGPGDVVEVDSATAGLATLEFAPCERERRLGERLRSLPCDDAVVERSLTARRARDATFLTPWDGDLSGVRLDPIAGPDAPAEVAVSPTRIQAWASCPHAYFVRHLLGVSPIDDRDRRIRIEPHERGNVIHDTLDAFHRDVIDGTLPQPTDHGWTEEHRTALLERFDVVCAHAERRGATGRPATWAGERAAIRHELSRWLELDGERARSHGVTVLASERSFPDERGDDDRTPVHLDLPDGRRLAVRGAVDRLDRRRDGTLVVTDHKTGKADDFRKLSTDDPTLSGSVFQLPTYAAAALRWTASPDGSPVRAEYSMFERGGFQRLGIEFDDGIWERVGADLGEIVAGIESGWFPPTPPRPGFSVFTECAYCDPDDLGTTDAWARWLAKRGDDRISRWFGEPPGPADGGAPASAGGSHGG